MPPIIPKSQSSRDARVLPTGGGAHGRWRKRPLKLDPPVTSLSGGPLVRRTVDAVPTGGEDQIRSGFACLRSFWGLRSGGSSVWNVGIGGRRENRVMRIYGRGTIAVDSGEWRVESGE